MVKKSSLIKIPKLMRNKDLEDLVETVLLLNEYFKDKVKAAKWIGTKNPFFGDIAPISLFYIQRGSKVLKFVKNQKQENGW